MNIQKIGDRTAELLNLYYNNEIEPFLNSCHEDVLWIGPADKQVIRGRKNLVDAFHAEKHESDGAAACHYKQYGGRDHDFYAGRYDLAG